MSATICIAGMHRSGTSMITRMLNLCGMDLGAPEEMMPASPDNPEGYWEHSWFTNANNAILDCFGGAWDIVPDYPAHWQEAEGLLGVKADAQRHFARFAGKVWGWKDPRNSITMAFWRQFAPKMKVVVCLRNPWDVAASLSKRGSASELFGLRLWWQYNSRLLLETEAADRVVTHYDCYFRDGKAELQPMLERLGMEASESQIAQACGTLRVSLRHALTSLRGLQAKCLWPELVRCYCKLLSEAGEGCRATVEDWEEVQRLAGQWTPQDCYGTQDWLATGLGARRQLQVAENNLVQERKHAEQLLAEIARQDQDNRRLATALQDIQASISWRVLTKIRVAGMRMGLLSRAPLDRQ